MTFDILLQSVLGVTSFVLLAGAFICQTENFLSTFLFRLVPGILGVLNLILFLKLMAIL
jgi:hypothetical protein